MCSVVAYDMKYIANVLLFDCSHVPALHVIADAAAAAAVAASNWQRYDVL